MSYTVKDLELISSSVVSSGLFPEIKNKEMALTMMLMCQAEGFHPVQAFRRYHVVSNKISLKADAILSDFKKSGGVLEWIKYDDNECIGSFICEGMKSPLIVNWNMDMAKKAGLLRNGSWDRYPRQMLKARVISEGVRATMPSIVEGLYTTEEMKDIVEEKQENVKKEKEKEVNKNQDKRHISNLLEKIMPSKNEDDLKCDLKVSKSQEESSKMKKYEDEIDRQNDIDELNIIVSQIPKENFSETAINYLKLKYRAKKEWLKQNNHIEVKEY